MASQIYSFMRTIFSSILHSIHFHSSCRKNIQKYILHLFPTHRITKQKTPKVQNKGTKKMCVFFRFWSQKKKQHYIHSYKWCQFQFSPASLWCKEQKKNHRWTLTASSLTRKSRYVSLDLPHAFKKQYKPKVI